MQSIPTTVAETLNRGFKFAQEDSYGVAASDVRALHSSTC